MKGGIVMRNLTPTHHPSGSAIPPEPNHVAIAGARWQRSGFLQRLVKLDREAHTLAAEDREPAETPAARRAA
jgi:hypothetical protein